MKERLLDQIVNAILYEGYVLYPYRASSKKNQRERFTFGRVYPEAYSIAENGREPCMMQTECLLRRPATPAKLQVSVRFLHPLWREVGKLADPIDKLPALGEPAFQVVPELSINGQVHHAWQEAMEEKIEVPPVSINSGITETVRFALPSSRKLIPLVDYAGHIPAVLIRRKTAVEGSVEVEIKQATASLFKVTVRIRNLTPAKAPQVQDSDAVLMRTFASTHVVLHAPEAEFISQLDPPAEYESIVADCKNIGAWPVLVGDESVPDRDTMLASPIILYDYPKIAPESGGDFCDGTEMDEMLTLRVLTMTDAEKREMREIDGFARKILERTEALPPEQFLKLHGTMRDVRAAEEYFNPNKPITSVVVRGVELKAGDRVRIHPRNRADAIDMILAGKSAVVEAVEQDAENRVHVAVVLEDDPGKDLGMARQPGHRFFYGTDEVEPLKEAAA